MTHSLPNRNELIERYQGIGASGDQRPEFLGCDGFARQIFADSRFPLFEGLLSGGVRQRWRCRQKVVNLRGHLGADRFEGGGALLQGGQSRRAIDFRHDNPGRGIMSAAPLQFRALRLEFGAREKLFLQRARLFGQIGNEPVQILSRVTEL